jgi:hypothetical protein
LRKINASEISRRNFIRAGSSAIMAITRDINSLKAARFSNNDISVLLPDKGNTKNFAHQKNTKAPEGVVQGGNSTAAASNLNSIQSALRPVSMLNRGTGTERLESFQVRLRSMPRASRRSATRLIGSGDTRIAEKIVPRSARRSK